MGFQVFSSSFSEGGEIPDLHTCMGADLSPPLEWSGAPSGTRSYALLMEDPDAPSGAWTHWLVYDLAATVAALPAGARVALSGKNDFGGNGYGGPCPPKGHGAHRYYFRLFALDVETLGLADGAGRIEILTAVRRHLLASAQCMGRFERH